MDAIEAATKEAGAEEIVAQTAETLGATMEDDAVMTAAAEIDRICLLTDEAAAVMTAMTATDEAVAGTDLIETTVARIATT